LKNMTRWVKGHGAIMAMAVVMLGLMMGWQNQAGATTVKIYTNSDSYVSSVVANQNTNYGSVGYLNVGTTEYSYLKFYFNCDS
jgi:hypothetical protein